MDLRTISNCFPLHSINWPVFTVYWYVYVPYIGMCMYRILVCVCTVYWYVYVSYIDMCMYRILVCVCIVYWYVYVSYIPECNPHPFYSLRAKKSDAD